MNSEPDSLVLLGSIPTRAQNSKPDEARSPKKFEPVPALNRTAAKANQLLICRETRGSVARALSQLQDDGFDDSLSVGGNPSGRISAA